MPASTDQTLEPCRECGVMFVPYPVDVPQYAGETADYCRACLVRDALEAGETAEAAGMVARYLSGRARTIAHPVTVTIGRTTYCGAYFSQTRDVHPGCRAYAEGERTYVHSGLYCLGQLPASYRRSSRVAYVFSDLRWFVAGWFGQDAEQDCLANEYHPFGPMFLLMSDPDGTITRDVDDVPYPTMRGTLAQAV